MEKNKSARETIRKKRARELKERCERIKPIPERFRNWGKKQFEEPSWLFYKRHGNFADMFCCSCGQEFTVRIKAGETYEDSLLSVYPIPVRNEDGHCPKCNAKIRYKTGMRKDNYDFKVDTMLGQKYGKRGYVLRYIQVYKEFGPKKQDEYTYCEVARVFFRENVKKIQKDYQLYSYYEGTVDWRDHNVGGFGNVCIPACRIYPGTYTAMKGTVMEYSMAKEYVNKMYHTPYRWNEGYWDITQYLSMYWKYPLLEMFIKANAWQLAKNLANNFENRMRINTRAKTPSKMLGIKKSRIKDLLEKDRMIYLGWYRYEYEKGKEIKDDLIDWYCQDNIYVKNLDFIIGKMSLQQIKNYLEKQCCHCAMGGGPSVWQLIREWNDYMWMCKEAGYDINDSIVYKPKAISAAHQKLVNERNQEEVSGEAKKVYKKYSKIKENMEKAAKKYAYSNGEYVLVMPTTVEEIMLEGRALHHCVSASDRYFDRINEKETYIGFVRKASEPDVAFYSIEFEPGGNVRQKRTFYNRHDSNLDKVVEFLLEWQQEVKKRLTPKERKLAETSQQKRVVGMKEFFEKSPEFAKELEKDFLQAGDEPPQIMLEVAG